MLGELASRSKSTSPSASKDPMGSLGIFRGGPLATLLIHIEFFGGGFFERFFG